MPRELTTEAASEKDAIMKRVIHFGIILISLVVVMVTGAQTPRRRPAASPPPPKPTPIASPIAQPSPTQPAEIAPLTLATVNGSAVTAADIQDQVNALVMNGDPYLAAFYQDRQQAILEARLRALDARIS